MKRMLFLINPNAGHSGIRAGLLGVLERFCGAGYAVEVYTTAGPQEVTEHIAASEGKYDTVVVSGGDGTLNEAIAGLLRLRERPVLGYLPAGTANDVAATLGLPMEPEAAAEIILHGRETELDVGLFNGRPYTYVAAFGAFTEVSYATPQNEKRAFGRLAYLLEGARSLGGIRPIRVKVTADGVSEEGDFLFGAMCSTRSMGGFRAREIRNLTVSLNDGLSEVVFVRELKNIKEFGELVAEATRFDFTDPRHFLTFQADHLLVEFEEDVAWTVDGEDGGSCRRAELRTLPRAIRVMIPA